MTNKAKIYKALMISWGSFFGMVSPLTERYYEPYKSFWEENDVILFYSFFVLPVLFLLALLRYKEGGNFYIFLKKNKIKYLIYLMTILITGYLGTLFF